MFLSLLIASKGKNARDDNPDPELLQRCMRGERAALDRLFAMTYPIVRRMMARFLGPGTTELEDVVQTALMEIFRSLKNFKGQAKFTSWVFRICMNVSNQYLRQKVRRDDRSNLFENSMVIDTHPSGEKDLLDREALLKVYEVVNAMPPKLRQVYVLAEMEQMGSAEIAEILDCSVQAVWSRLHQARKMFWQKMDRSDYFTPTENP